MSEEWKVGKENAQPTGSTASSTDWAHLHHLGTSLEQPANPPVTSPIPEGIKGLIATPEVYGGDPEACEGFIIQCELFFGYQPWLTDHTKVSFVISRLTGKAHKWCAALVTSASSLMNDYPEIIQELRTVFNHTRQGRFCGQALLHLRQDIKPPAKYTMEFHTLAAGTGWNEPALINAFLGGLQAELALSRKLPL
ncbi:hypothetical protein P4O66_013037 [Electrophorus voltai]|uniref:DUF4939 domain-containing protein n=1 Tax=Electrophorus voltai TaxID=2609070 RepID=A0AAD9E698_9TELE|nr:hypothetical protein P4O66_013037 [Electrophorus voltai]